MREATMGSLPSLDAVRPRKSSPQRKTSARGGGKRGPVRSAFSRLRSRLTLIIASAGFSAIMVGIVFNAMVLQKGHHPAPLFGTASAPAPIPRPASAPPPVAAPMPAALPPVTEPVVDPQQVAPAAPAIVHHPLQLHAAGPVHHATAPAHRVDGIAGLLGRSMPGIRAPTQRTAANSTTKAASPRKPRPAVPANSQPISTPQLVEKTN